MIFRTEQNSDGQWMWRLRSTKLMRDVAECTSPVPSEKDCLERIEFLRQGIPFAQVVTSTERRQS